LIHWRIHPLLDKGQSRDQVGFRHKLGVDHVFAVLETMVGKCIEWREPLWIASRDLRKAFDRIEFDSLFHALSDQGVPLSYLSLLSTLYHFQSGCLKDGRQFRIERGVKQGDVLSPSLFNAGLEHAFRNWKAKLRSQGLHVGLPERLTNVRYADDIVLYAKTSDELVFMMESLIQELGKIGLHLSPHKTKVFTTSDVESALYLDICGDMVEVLMPDSVHKYLGRHLDGNLFQRHITELNHRIHVAWYKLQLHRKVLTNRHVSIKLRLKLFDATVTPTVLYGLHTLSLTQQQLQKLDIVLRRMLRSIVGWIRVSDEPWPETMKRMKLRVEQALKQYPVEMWTTRLARRQYHFASQVAESDSWARHVCTWHPAMNWTENFTLCPSRRPGRPLTRWDDRLRSFCKRHFPNAPCWTNVAACTAWKVKEREFVRDFMVL